MSLKHPGKIELRLIDLDFKYSLLKFDRFSAVTFHPFNQEDYIPENLMTFIIDVKSLLWKRYFEPDILYLQKKSTGYALHPEMPKKDVIG